MNAGDGTYIEHQLQRRQDTPSLYGGDYEKVKFKVTFYGDKMLRFTVSTAIQKRLSSKVCHVFVTHVSIQSFTKMEVRSKTINLQWD